MGNDNMRLLIVTQAVDLDDPILGFFHGWLCEFASHVERIHAICLKEGAHVLPGNVAVHTLGKSTLEIENWKLRILHRFLYAARFYRLLWQERRNYDTVFVHMNQEYVLLGGLVWRAMGKRIVLWRNHARGSLSTRVAGLLAHTVCYTSPQSFTARLQGAVQMPIGIDTKTFVPALARPDLNTILFLGRLDPIKNVDVCIAALQLLDEKGIHFKADIYGDPTDPASVYAHDVRNQAAVLCLEGKVTMKAGISNREAAELFSSHAIYVNLTPAGSFDKTIGEALSAGCTVVALNPAVEDIIPAGMYVKELSAPAVADALQQALQLSLSSREELSRKGRACIEQKHSLRGLVEKLMPYLEGTHT